MSQSHQVDTDDNAVPAAVRRFLVNRLFELAGLMLLGVTLLTTLALATWSTSDPSRYNAANTEPANLLGQPGALVADELMQVLGLAALMIVAIPLVWSVSLMSHKTFRRPLLRLSCWVIAILSASAFLSSCTTPGGWVLATGLGGSIGDILAGGLLSVLAVALKGSFAAGMALFLAGLSAFWAALAAAGVTASQAIDFCGIFGTRFQDTLVNLTGRLSHLNLYITGLWQRLTTRKPMEQPAAPAQLHKPIAPSGSNMWAGAKAMLARWATPAADAQVQADRVEPVLATGHPAGTTAHEPEADGYAEEAAYDEYAPDPDYIQPIGETANYGEIVEEQHPAAAPSRVSRTAKPVAQAAPPKRGRAAGRQGGFELPPLDLLSEPQKADKPAELSDEALDQNARMLEGVLEDFGVRGEIIEVRPGPVVTLYELEPAPGIKSSRVIGLADDIARSMSAISARVAVVPGRNVIGIELPNATRETVFLREMLGSQSYAKTKQNLALALGKNIGGEPIFADLARMPHLLIAGTTGSGKSVGINTMILSLLYKHSPDQCKLIMIDPKMLELSIYEGIPHLLAPVVTDPRKAVVALKWTVREMEERYRNMSRLGVRNIDGFNKRVKEALKKQETVTRTVQTGYDPETGEPVYESEELDLKPIPYIVVIIDEMADLMMVAGKEIEGAVQRLAQMARAAGIHVIMATQRPSVDVITGTIKANFPTRISFQVTSKIDSRTILGEMGAEQLLGQGDMLYMAGGGRIARLHGPFVKDEEVEDIVRFLKSQGAPEYVEAVTEDDGSDGEGGGANDGIELPGGSSGNELYDKAVAVVIRDKKVSTSYIQRRLQIGYNRAASLIEKMENEGVISAANHAGKREILVGNNEPE